MTFYLDVAVVRIQSWLVRAPHLRGRRGASTMIRRATDPQAVKKILDELGGLAERNDEAGHIDGVVPLKLATADLADAAQVENHVVRQLREVLPAASFATKLFEGESTIAAHATEPCCETDWPPLSPEWVLGKQCDWCRSWPASARRSDTDQKRVELCTDCLKRHTDTAGAGFATALPRGPRQPGTERDLIYLWELQPDAWARVPDTFDELAKLGKTGDNTHLATIHADGNAVGLLTTELRALQRQGVAMDFDLPSAIENATWSSLLTAVLNMDRSGADENGVKALPITAHFVGGDDILVSVPAHAAWRFLLSMQATFAATMSDQLGPVGLAKKSPTLSAAVVFHHRTSQLSAAVDLAGELLDTSKKQHRGERAALAWQDITHDGPHPIQRPSMALATLKDFRCHLDALAKLSGSAKTTLGRLFRRDPEPGHLLDHADRLAIRPTVEPFLKGDGPNLGDALGMVRWWA
ncbi:Cas10/Cmr2 second palm domain-containing protein [Saccharopolyspora griseoalba]|uniref:Cas10/Cmr2 second palm domain-containing protein n=1 Tax=Saccharopolyspora griseoalba TaxID=1431848 RepID=A0ABW2LPL4_9PSEU